jgi:hypothetical protein
MAMSKLFPLALVALALTAGAPATMANNRYDPYWTDMSKPCGGFSCNSLEGQRAFWDYQQENAGRSGR